MDARQLEYFLAIVEHDGFGRAAQHLHIAQPSLSQAIANLTRRFTRRYPGITLDAAAAFTPGEVVDKVRQGACELGLLGASGPISAPASTCCRSTRPRTCGSRWSAEPLP